MSHETQPAPPGFVEGGSLTLDSIGVPRPCLGERVPSISEAETPGYTKSFALAGGQ